MFLYTIYVQLILSQSYGGSKPHASSEAKFSMGCECGRRQKDPEMERHCQETAKIEGGGMILGCDSSPISPDVHVLVTTSHPLTKREKVTFKRAVNLKKINLANLVEEVMDEIIGVPDFLPKCTER